MGLTDDLVLRQRRGDGKHIPELAHVSGPIVVPQSSSGTRAQPSSVLGPTAAEEVVRQQQDIVAAITQRRETHRADAETEEQIVAKGSFLDHHGQIAMGRGDHASVDVAGTALADPTDFPLLQDPQQLALCLGLEIADLVQKDGAGPSRLEHAGPIAIRPGEGAPGVSKQVGED